MVSVQVSFSQSHKAAALGLAFGQDEHDSLRETVLFGDDNLLAVIDAVGGKCLLRRVGVAETFQETGRASSPAGGVDDQISVQRRRCSRVTFGDGDACDAIRLCGDQFAHVTAVEERHVGQGFDASAQLKLKNSRDPRDFLAQRILDGLAQPGVHRALVDLTNWTLLKWLDDPAPFFDWRASMAGERAVYPADRPQMAKMAEQFASGTASGVLRMVAPGGGWTPVHVTVNRVELDDEVYAGLATLRQPGSDSVPPVAGAPDEPS